MKLTDLQTPALILDRRILTANTKAMTARIAQRGARLRPHLKTAKSLDVARIALKGNFGGITVATLNEAEYFAEGGIRDILYAVCVTPDKLARAAALLHKGVHLSLITDNAAVARTLDRQGSDLGAVFETMIEIDSGEHRTGVDPEGKELFRIAEILHGSNHTGLLGILTHAGHAYECTDPAAIRLVAEEERRLAVLAADRLRTAGFTCPHVSIGSTPTAVHGASAEGVTEVRAGVYMTGDLFQAEKGSCTVEEIALSVLATVISHDPVRNHLLLDAGGLALSKDLGTKHNGYGRVMDLQGIGPIGDLWISNVHQEHGEVSGASPLPFRDLPVGARVRVLPNHACMTAAMYDRFFVVDGPGEEVVATWPKTSGWL